jgi:glycosyltransferase involved in cell wall biosynthesis
MTTSQQPKVSVLMPVWNAERYLAGAIESILTQTFANFELLIIDDGSTDRTPIVIRDYHDHRIRRIENEKNIGITKSLNLGLEQVRGEYVARMDADDISSPQRLARQVECLDANPQVALVTSRTSKVDARGARLDVIQTPVESEVLRRRLRIGNCIAHGSVMMRTDALRSIGGYDESMERAQDYDLWLRLSERHDLMSLPETLYAWREHDDSVAGRGLEEQQRFAERARRAARTRWATKLVSEVNAETVSIERGARRTLDLLREEETLLPTSGRVKTLLARAWRRLPRLHMRWYEITHLDALERLERVLAACVSGWQGPEETARALATCIVELDQARRVAPSRGSQ